MTERTLREKLQNKFNLEEWKKVLEQCFPERTFYASPKAATFSRKEQEELAEHIHHIGEVDLDDAKLAFIDVKLKEDATQLTRNRVGLRKLVDSEVIAGVRDAAIIVYHQPGYPEWRISFYSEQYGWDENNEIVKEETNPKRYTFVVGGNETCRTPSDRLHDLVEASATVQLDDVMKAFSVEKVSKRFFDEYKHQYDKFVSYLTGKVWTKDGEQEVGKRINQFNFFFQATSDHEKEARDFVKKLLGRIVFLYFVQKKEWLGASSDDFTDGSQKFIRKLFEQVSNDSDPDLFYSTWLRKLFFEGLNDKEDLSFEMPDGSTCYMPFLNGGLFEQDETDQNTEGLPLPGKLFSNPDYKEVEEDKYDRPNKRGFLDFLDAFNFTIHEDSPGDHTIAVDPEMLGHIFENLLEDNKEKGAYYTPKPIVHYMCQESIIEYLNTELDGDEQLRSDIKALIKDQETGGVDHFYEEILTALKEVKVCDPAIGSGAFPMGILQEIYQTVETIYYASPDSVKATWELSNGDWAPAAIKKQIIQHSIYGVDIEQGAVDIARLRFWLSLIVDEQKPTPLPNLEYKIRTGNSLLSTISFNGEDEPIEIDWEIDASNGGLWGQDEIEKKQEILEEIHEKQDLFFNSEEVDKNKEPLGLKIRNLKIALLINQLQLMVNTQGLEEKPQGSGRRHKQRMETYLQTKEWKQTIGRLNKLKEQPDAPFNHFEWKLDFPEVLNPVIAGENAGFDLVIGNPPYVRHEEIKELKQFLKQKYDVYNSTADLYTYFIELSYNILSDEGIFQFIVSNKFMRANYGRNLRMYLSEKVNLTHSIDFSDAPVFDEATVDANILGYSKKSKNDEIRFLEVKDDLYSQNSFGDYVYENHLKMNQKYLDGDTWYFYDSRILRLSDKINEVGKKLSELDYNIKFGVKTGFNKAFIINDKTKKELIAQDENAEQIIHPIIRGRDIHRYSLNNSKKWILGVHNGYNDHERINVEDFPSVKNYLDKFLEKLENRYDQGDTPYNLRNCAYWGDFFGEKIVWADIMRKTKSNPDDFPRFYLDKSKKIVEATAFMMTGEKLHYLIGLLSSKLITWFFIKFLMGTSFDTGGIRYKKAFVEKIPVATVSERQEEFFREKVEQILSQKQTNPEADTTKLEKQIDLLVYKLYNLTWEEVKVVDPEFALSEEEYENFNI